MNRDVTVVIPTHNRPMLAARATRIALSQAGGAPPVIVVDNGSSPANAARCRALESERVSVIVESEPLGPNGARNIGVEAASTRWIAFLDDDDVWSPVKLQVQLALLERDAAARWCGCAAVFFNQSGRITHLQPAPEPRDLLRTLLAANRISGGGSSVVIERDLLREVGGFDTQLAFGEEWECWIRVARVAPAVFAREPLVGYFTHDEAASVVEDWRQPDLVEIERRFAALRDELGVAFDWNSHIYATASRLMFARRRLAASRTFVTLARRQPSFDAIAGAVGSLVAPGATAALGQWRARRRMPRRDLAEVERWLPAALATGPAPASA